MQVQPPAAEAILVSGDPVKNAQAILRNALPVVNKPIRQIQVGIQLQLYGDVSKLPIL